MTIDLEHYGPGRPPLPETVKTLEKMVREIRKEPGIQSAKLARKLGISSLECATLARRLKKRGVLNIDKEAHSLVYSLADAA